MENNYKKLADEQLAELAQGGSLEAEECLIRNYKEMVRTRAQLYFIMGADGEDVVQEGMIGLFKAIQSYDADREASFHTFAELCINRQIGTAIKTASRKKHVPLNTSVSLNKPASEEDQTGTLQETLADSGADPEELLVLKDVVKGILNNEGNIFSRFEREVWNEYLQGKSCRQIAGEMGKTPKAVDNAMQRNKKKILSYLCQ